jgi:cell division septal protein FtsQ
MTMENGNEIILILADYPTRVRLGDSNTWSRVEVLKQFQQKIGGKKQLSDFTYLDMRYNNQVIVKERL